MGRRREGESGDVPLPPRPADPDRRRPDFRFDTAPHPDHGSGSGPGCHAHPRSDGTVTDEPRIVSIDLTHLVLAALEQAGEEED